MNAQQPQMNTDRRLGLLILGGDTLLHAIDPQGIASGARAAKLRIERAGEGDRLRWSLDAVFPNGDGFRAVGESSDSDTSIRQVLVLSDGTWTKASGKAGKTLLETFGPLDGLPVHLKRNLSPTAPQEAANGESEKVSWTALPKTYFEVALDALCFKTEGGDASERRARFRKLKASFNRRHEEAATSVDLTATCEMSDGRISLGAKADVYGLSRKRCTMQKDLGLKHRVEAECTAERKGAPIPSVRAAFDLYETIPTLYSEQLINRNGRGPRLPGMK